MGVFRCEGCYKNLITYSLVSSHCPVWLLRAVIEQWGKVQEILEYLHSVNYLKVNNGKTWKWGYFFCIHIVVTLCIFICMLNFMFWKLLFYHVCNLSTRASFCGGCLFIGFNTYVLLYIVWFVHVSMLSCCSNGISCWMLFSNQILSIQLIFKCIRQQIASKKVAALQLDPRPYSGDICSCISPNCNY